MGVRESLGGLADAIPPRGYLIYTGQPWHPQSSSLRERSPVTAVMSRGSCVAALRLNWTSWSKPRDFERSIN